MTKPKMAVVRAFPRRPEFNFYTAFENIQIKLIGNNAKLAKIFQKQNSNIESILLPLKQAWYLDPIEIIQGKQTHRSWATFENLERHLKDCQIINVSDTYYFYCRQAARLAKKQNKPLVTVVWENIPRPLGVLVPPYSLIVKEVVQNTTLFVLRSKSALGFTDSLGIPRKKVKVIYKGIDVGIFCPSRKSKLSKSKIQILYVGQIARSKGVEDLLNVFDSLCQQFPNLELVLAGKMRLKNGLKKYEGLPMKYLGFVDYAELPKIYRQADIFCSPTRDKERFSYTLMEAQASGLPIVATKVGGIPEEIGEKNFLVDQGDLDGLYAALEELINNQSLRSNMGRQNRKRAEKLFDLNKQAIKTEEAILSII